MNTRKITADHVLPISSEAIPQGVIVLDQQGTIVEIGRRSDYDPTELEVHSGTLVPGFINTHCHLELSHLKGVAPTGTGLIPFLQTVVAFREVEAARIQEAIVAADQAMYDAGIVAVGDISNKSDTAHTKNSSPIRYYTFVEMFDFMQDDGADRAFDNYHSAFIEQSDAGKNRKSVVPHAPYTVSRRLFQKINQVNAEADNITVSIHNQETHAENELFESKSGAFLDFYRAFQITLEDFQPTGRSSIHYALQNMDPTHRTLFVHNTMTTVEDIRTAQAWSRDKVFWATCPNANLYIENRLPDYREFLTTGATVTIGTDSLTSNWQLSVLEELKTIKRFQSYLPTGMLLRWATLNGAKALGFEDDLGSLEVGKTPGLNLLLNLNAKGELQTDTQVRRLV